MLPVPIAASPSSLGHATSSAAQTAIARGRTRAVLIASSDSSLRERLRTSLAGLHWQVLEAPGGAQAWMISETATQLEALLIDPWLPDLDVAEFLGDFHRDYPHVDIVMTDGVSAEGSPRSPYHQELLYALRRSQEGDTAAWHSAPPMGESPREPAQPAPSFRIAATSFNAAAGDRPGAGFDGDSGYELETSRAVEEATSAEAPAAFASFPSIREKGGVERIPELIGSTPAMLEVSRRVRLGRGTLDAGID